MLEKLSSLNKKLSKLPEIVAIVLYGSFARGGAGSKSDIDLLIIVKKKNMNIEKKIEKIIESEKAGKKVVQTVSTTDELIHTPYFFFDILRDGIVLYKNPSEFLRLPTAFGESAATIYCFDNPKKQSEKTRLNRILYGSGFVKILKTNKRQNYRYLGFIEKTKGRKLGSGVVMVPSSLEKEIEEIFKNFKLKFRKMHFIFVEQEKFL